MINKPFNALATLQSGDASWRLGGSAGPQTDEDQANANYYDVMRQQNMQTDGERGIGVIQFRGGQREELSPIEAAELKNVRRQKAAMGQAAYVPHRQAINPSTFFGRIAEERNRWGKFAPIPGMAEKQDQALLQHYPDSPALKALLGLK